MRHYFTTAERKERTLSAQQLYRDRALYLTREMGVCLVGDYTSLIPLAFVVPTLEALADEGLISLFNDTANPGQVTGAMDRRMSS